MNNTFMRIPKELLSEIKKSRVTPRESYAEVVKRLVDRERKFKGKKIEHEEMREYREAHGLKGGLF